MAVKYSFEDVKIGDTVVTTNNESGVVVALKSYEYLNDKLLRKATASETMLIDLLPFQNDGSRHRNVWYSTLTIAVQDPLTKQYYLLGVDFVEVKEVVRDMSNVKVTWKDKLKKLFGK